MNDNAAIVCFGEVLWDVFPKEQKPGGAPLNVAVHLTNFGYEPTLVSRVGTDEDGENLVRFISNKGVNYRHIQYDNKHPTGVVNVHLDDSGNAKYDIVFPSAWDYTEYPENIEPGYNLIFGSLGSRNETARQTLLKLIENAKLSIFDVNFRAPHYTKELIELLLLKANIIKLNEEEIEIIGSWYGKKGATQEAQCSFFQEKFDLDLVILTLGSKGAAIFDQGKFITHPGYKVQVKDTVGSGDSFLASYIAHHFKGVSIEESLDMACATGAYVATQIGAVPEYRIADIRKIQKHQ
jgi:fructokinase